MPPNTPFLCDRARERDVYRILRGNASTRYAAIGPTPCNQNDLNEYQKNSIGTLGFGAFLCRNERAEASRLNGVRAMAPVTLFFVDLTVSRYCAA